MANTFMPISNVVVGAGGQSSIDFNSIHQGYTDLVLKMSLRTSETGANSYGPVQIRFNGDTGSNYNNQEFIFTTTTSTSTSSSASQTSFTITPNNNSSTASSFSASELYISNYTLAQHKPCLLDNAVGTATATFNGGFYGLTYTSTDPITSISIASSGNTLMQYSSATLYGIKNS